MKNKSVIGLIVVLVVLVGISGCVTNDQTNNTTNTGNQTVQQNTIGNSTYNSTGASVSAAEAKNVAKKYIEQPGATVGEPTLINTDGKLTYMVPVMLNGNQVGEIIIDAKTGEFVAGAGGVSTDTK